MLIFIASRQSLICRADMMYLMHFSQINANDMKMMLTSILFLLRSEKGTEFIASGPGAGNEIGIHRNNFHISIGEKISCRVFIWR